MDGEDLVLADDDGVILLAAARAEEVFGLAEIIRDTERRRADRMRGGLSLRARVPFGNHLAERERTPSLSFRDHLRGVGGAIEV